MKTKSLLSFCAPSFLAMLFLASVCCTHTNKVSDTTPASDPNLWLENIESPEAIAKVKSWNAPTLAELEGDPHYKGIERDARSIILASDRIPYIAIRGKYAYNFWQDKKNVRGLWRRTTLGEYQKKSPLWQTIIDLDALAKIENENWVWKGSNCLPPQFEDCLVHLSRGGKDAVVTREFDVTKKAFVSDGFFLPEAKSNTSWYDANTLLAGTDTGPGSLTSSGYPRQVRKWKRGEKIENSPVIFEGQDGDVDDSGSTSFSPAGTWHFLIRGKTFFSNDIFLLKDDGTKVALPVPDDIEPLGTFQNQALGKLRKEWKSHGQVFPSGSVLALPLEHLSADTRPELVYAPGERTSVQGVLQTKSNLYILLSINVRSAVMVAMHDSGWHLKPVPVADDGAISFMSADEFQEPALIRYANFLHPDTLFMLKPQGTTFALTKLKSLPERFKSAGLVVEQNESTSRDGTKIPYFVIHRKNMKLDGQNPTLLYGYGGFEISLNPSYLGETGKAWSERGGVYVLANIRGGGEFGPEWHEAARLKNRQKAYDDFISVAEDLERRQVTSPRHLGIMGGSNGGLLVGAVFVERPDLFNAVVCQVPLLDMLRYNKLLVGASWMDEYGNPDDPDMAKVIRAYSPYQNLSPNKKYPRVFFITSTRDDRVHPGHARKMAAQMERFGDPFLYFENVEGGHGAAANLEQRVHYFSLEWTYLMRQLM